MPFNWEQITNDFRQKFEHTFIRVKIKEDFEVFFVEQVQYADPPFLILRNKNRGELQLNYDTDFELNFEFPAVGLFDFNGRSYCFVRQYQRQFKRGVCNSTALILSPYAIFFRSNIGMATDVLQAAFNTPSDRNLDQVLPLSDSVLSVRLNNHFFVGQDVRKQPTYLFWYMNSVIGEVIDNKVILHELQFKQEVWDYRRQTGGTFDII